MIHVRSALLGASVLGLVLFGLGAAQIRVNPPPAAISAGQKGGDVAWPPHPESLFQWSSYSSITDPVGPGEEIDLFQVPLDKRLVLRWIAGPTLHDRDLDGTVRVLDVYTHLFPNDWDGGVVAPGSWVFYRNPGVGPSVPEILVLGYMLPAVSEYPSRAIAWPPAFSDRWKHAWLDGPIEYQQGEGPLVFTVPSDKWLVLQSSFVGPNDFEFFSEVDGVLSRLANSPYHPNQGSWQGFVFPPGSSVLLRNRSGPPRTLTAAYLSGYLADA